MSFFQPFREITRQSPMMVVVIGFALFFVGQLFVQLFSGLLGLAFAGNAGAVQELIASGPEAMAASANLIRSSHIIGQIFSWGFAAVVTASMLGSPIEELMISKAPHPLSWLLAPLVILAAAPLAQWLIIDRAWTGFAGMEEFVQTALQLEQKAEASSLAILQQGGGLGLFLNIMTFALAPAICEELFFRGLIQRNLLRVWNPWIAIGVTAFLFSLLHISLFGFFARFFLGAVLGIIAWKAQSTWPAILAHFTFNLSTILSIHYGWDKQPEGIPVWMVLSGAILMTGFIFLLKKRRIGENDG